MAARSCDQTGGPQAAEEVLDVGPRGFGVDGELLGEAARGVVRAAAVEQRTQDQRSGGVQVPVLAAVLVEQDDPVFGVRGRHALA